MSLPCHYHASNCVGEFGQQLERSGGDKDWISKLVEEVIPLNERNEDIFRRWFFECKYDLTIYKVKLTTSANRGRMKLADRLKNAKMKEFCASGMILVVVQK